jgi:hypothetical protein
MSTDTDARIPLREAATRLADYRRYQKTRSGGKRELLQLLQGQQVRAVFDFPSDARLRIGIPANFWIATHSGEFLAQLTSNSKRGKHGQFLINPAKFIAQYVAWFSNEYLGEGISEERRATAAAEVASALVGMKTEKEACILESEWARFVQDTGLDQAEHHNEAAKSNKGRKPREGWDVVFVEVASEMLARQKLGQGLEQLKIAKVALSRARASGHTLDLKPDTVAKKIREIMDRSDQYAPKVPDR